MSFTPLAVRNLADHTAEAIRGLIASGQLQGGERLIEANIASQLGVSRGPVRDAFRQLRQEGLLRDVPRRGTYVVRLTPDDARDLLDLRAGLEARAARLFIERADGEATESVAEAAEILADACRTGDSATVAAADYAFHKSVCDGSGSDRLVEAFVRYATELRILLRSDHERLYETGIDLPEQHRDLLECLRVGDPALAESAFRTHVEETRDRLVRLLAEAAEA